MVNSIQQGNAGSWTTQTQAQPGSQAATILTLIQNGFTYNNGLLTNTVPFTDPSTSGSTVFGDGKTYNATIDYNPSTGTYLINGKISYTFTDFIYSYTETIDPKTGQLTTTQQLNPNASLPSGFYTTLTDANGNVVTISNGYTIPVPLKDATATTTVTQAPYSETIPIPTASGYGVVEENPVGTPASQTVKVSLFDPATGAPTTSAGLGTYFVDIATGKLLGVYNNPNPVVTSQPSVVEACSFSRKYSGKPNDIHLGIFGCLFAKSNAISFSLWSNPV